MVISGLVGIISLFFLSIAMGQQPRLANARMQTRSAAPGLEREFRALVNAQDEPAWIGYAMPIIPGEHNMCCNYSQGCCAGCQLEGRKTGNIANQISSPIKLEGPRQFFVLLRVEQKRVEKIRSFTEDCELDAGGLPFIWLTDVRPAESIALLSSFAVTDERDTRDSRKVADSAVSAIAFHNDAAADQALEKFVAANQPESLRERTAFWLGNARGRRGYEVLKRMLRDDPSAKVRDKVIFALTQSREPEALATLIDAARNDASTHVRGQALFWLGQKAGQKAADAITEAIDKDPETEVKKKAVFALSQLPRDEGVPKLIEVARANRNPEVRKQAIFWLGQSRDARALAFFEEVLLRK
jgi:hypothetical protein